MSGQKLDIGLQHGDQRQIANMTGYTLDYVWKVLNGIRTNDKIVKAAHELVRNRERIAETYNRNNQA